MEMQSKPTASRWIGPVGEEHTDRTDFIHRLSKHVDDTAQCLVADRHLPAQVLVTGFCTRFKSCSCRSMEQPSTHPDRGSRVDHALAPHQTVSRVHGNSAQGVLSKMLCDLQHQAYIMALNLQGSQDGWQLAVKLHVHNCTNDLYTDIGCLALCRYIRCCRGARATRSDL